MGICFGYFIDSCEGFRDSHAATRGLFSQLLMGFRVEGLAFSFFLEATLDHEQYAWATRSFNSPISTQIEYNFAESGFHVETLCPQRLRPKPHTIWVFTLNPGP